MALEQRLLRIGGAKTLDEFLVGVHRAEFVQFFRLKFLR